MGYIDRVARGCHNGAIFISDTHTFDHFKQSLFHPQLANRSRFEQWHEKGAKEMRQRCNERARRILAEHQVAPKGPFPPPPGQVQPRTCR